MKYIIVTPARNEEKYIENTIRSVILQTVKPQEWIILNDNSIDKTKQIVEIYSNRYQWINLIDVRPFGINELSARVVYLIRLGMQSIHKDYEYLMKLDADVYFKENFIENLLKEFEKDPKLGIASGHLMYKGVKEKIRFGDNTRGAAKLYRKKCLDDIGGLYLSRGWDVMDDVAARSNGWKTRTLDYGFEHNKKEGLKSGLIKKHYLTGVFNGRVPYHPLYFALKLISQVFHRPYLITPVIQLIGYINSRFIDRKRPFPKEISEYLRREQIDKVKKFLYLKTYTHQVI